MAWKDWSYKLKGFLVGIILGIILIIFAKLISLVSPNFYMYYFLRAWIYELITFGLFGLCIGWIIDSVKGKESATKTSLKVGISLFLFIAIFIFYVCYFIILYGAPLEQANYLKCFSFNFTINNGWLALFLAILIPVLIGFVIDKIRRTENKSREILLSMLFAGVIILIILGLYGLGSFFYSNNPSKCDFYSDKDACYSEIALNLVNQGKLQKSLCEKIQYDSLRFKCFIWLAGQNKDLQVCENIPYLPTKDKCIGNLAVVQNDISTCDKVQPEFKNECLTWVSQGSSSY